MVKRKSNDELMLEKLDQILRVLALNAVSEMSVTDGAWALKQAGIDYKTISEILNISTSSVRTLVSRRSRKK